MDKKKPRAKKTSEEEVIKEIFDLKCYRLFSNYQIKQHLKEKYGYTESTSQRYVELLRQKVAQEVKYDYQDALANMIEFLKNEIQQTNDRMLKIQYLKELSKIQNLGNKQQIDITSGGEPIQYIINLTGIDGDKKES